MRSKVIPGPSEPSVQLQPGVAEEGKTDVRPASHLRAMAREMTMSKRALGAFEKGLSLARREIGSAIAPQATPQRLTVREIWNKLLELFDRIFEKFDRAFGNEATECTYRVRDAIKNHDYNTLRNLLVVQPQNTAIRYELLRRIQENEPDLLQALFTQDNEFEALRAALGISDVPVVPPDQPEVQVPGSDLSSEPPPVVDQAPVPSQTPPPSSQLDSISAQVPAEPLIPADQLLDAKAVANELWQLKANNHQKFMERVRALDVEQLGAVLEKNDDLLPWLSFNQIRQLIQAKKDLDLDFCEIILDRIYVSHLPQLLPTLNVEQLEAVLEKKKDLLERLNHDHLLQLLPALNAKQLEVILGNSPLLLNRLTTDQILWIFQDKDKDPDFCGLVLLAIRRETAESVLERNTKDMLADMRLDTVVSLLTCNISSSKRVEILRQLQLPPEKLAQLTADQRTALLYGLNPAQRTQMEALLPAPAPPPVAQSSVQAPAPTPAPKPVSNPPAQRSLASGAAASQAPAPAPTPAPNPKPELLAPSAAQRPPAP
ncbi:MAG: hypothetical protein LBF42_01200, partial [Puniceicoccales bacterium]|nr:hypothetical protein [Puniceicoccales bacterium]